MSKLSYLILYCVDTACILIKDFPMLPLLKYMLRRAWSAVLLVNFWHCHKIGLVIYYRYSSSVSWKFSCAFMEMLLR